VPYGELEPVIELTGLPVVPVPAPEGSDPAEDRLVDAGAPPLLVLVALALHADAVTGGVVPCGGVVVRWQIGRVVPALEETPAALVLAASVAAADGCEGGELCALAEVELPVEPGRFTRIRRAWLRCARPVGPGVCRAIGGAVDESGEATLAATVAATVAAAVPSAEVAWPTLSAAVGWCTTARASWAATVC
jgi:hypothetical protein